MDSCVSTLESDQNNHDSGCLCGFYFHFCENTEFALEYILFHVIAEFVYGYESLPGKVPLKVGERVCSVVM